MGASTKGRCFMVIGVLLAIVVVVTSLSCTSKTPPPPATAPAQNVTGILKSVNATAEEGKGAITVETAQGLQTFPITSNTTYTLEGKICKLEDINKVLEAANVSYNCTLVYDEELGAIGVYVTKK